MPDEHYGKITVHVTAADSAVPINNATVAFRIMNDGSTAVFAVLQTDKSGETETLDIPTPSVELSLSPDPKSTPYTSIIVEVSAPGFYSTANVNVPIFDGVTSVQNVNLIARPDLDDKSFFSPETITVEGVNPAL